MTSNLKIASKTPKNQLVAFGQERRQLLRIFWLVVTTLFIAELYTAQTSSIANVLGAIAIAFTALLPLYLWCAGKALEMPIFPIFALTFL